jgi:hypothetical protein
MADVRDGVGPYLSVFLKGGQNWQPSELASRWRRQALQRHYAKFRPVFSSMASR